MTDCLYKREKRLAQYFTSDSSPRMRTCPFVLLRSLCTFMRFGATIDTFLRHPYRNNIFRRSSSLKIFLKHYYRTHDVFANPSPPLKKTNKQKQSPRMAGLIQFLFITVIYISHRRSVWFRMLYRTSVSYDVENTSRPLQIKEIDGGGDIHGVIGQQTRRSMWCQTKLIFISIDRLDNN